MKRKLLNSDAHIYQFLDRGSVLQLVQQHLDGRENRRLLIWSLLNAEAWCESTLQ